MSAIYYGQKVGIFSEDGEFRLDIGTDAMKKDVPATHDSWATRLIIKRLDGESSGAISDEHVVGVFSEDGQVRLDIGTDAMKKNVPATHDSWATRLIIKRLNGESAGEVCYGDIVGIFSEDEKYRLDIGTDAVKKNVPAAHNSWATRLRIQNADPITDVGKRLSAWLGVYTTDTQWWGGYFSPLVVQLDGTVTLCDEPMRYSYDAAKATLTIPKQPWNAQNKDKSDGIFCGCMLTFSASKTPEGTRGTFAGVLQPRPQDGNVPFTGAAPVTTQYKASSADVKAIAKAYGVVMDDATCYALAEALPAFPPPPQSGASPRMAAATQVGWKTGALIGGIVGGIVGGIIGSLFPGPGTAAGTALGTAIGSQFGLGLAYAEDPQQVIIGVEHESEHGCCVDVNKKTYPVGWIPWVADLKSWRSYDPTTIPGVGILVRSVTAPDGTKQLIGKNLMTKQEEVLVDHGDGGHYSWVFHPSQAIIYKWNSGEAIKKGDYIRHSQLAGGVPVICAGEWTLDQGQIGYMIATINDSSGHYKPDGGKCMGPVLNKLQLLGVDPNQIKVTTV